MAWKLSGTYFETSSYEVVCPCSASLALGADHDRCNATLVFHVRSRAHGPKVNVGEQRRAAP